MIIDEDLTFNQKAQGRRYLLIFSLFNGVSHICITGNILVLYLLKAGCSSSIAVSISFLFYIGSTSVIFSKFFISRLGSAKTMSFTLFLRGISALLLALAPFITLFIHNKATTMVFLLIFALMYFSFRSIGAPAMRPLFSDLTDADNKGKFTSSYFYNYNLAMLLFIVISYFLLRHNKNLFMFQLIIGIGAVTNFVSCLLMSFVNETKTAISSSKGIALNTIYKNCWLNKDVRNFFIARGCSIAICAIIVQVSVVALKDIYKVSDSFALIFTIVQLVGSISLTYINKLIAEYAGPKPLMIIYILCLVLISVLWLFSPFKINLYFITIIFFVGGVTISGITASSFHYFLLITPKENPVGYSIMLSITTGIIAGVSGVVIGGGLVELLFFLIVEPILVYKYFYIIMVILCIPVVYSLSRMKNYKGGSIPKVLRLLFSPKALLTLHLLSKIKKYDSVSKEFKYANRLIFSRTFFSEQAIIYYLNSPNSLIRLKALKAIFDKKILKKFQPVLLKELENGEYSTGHFAAHIAGRNKIQEAVPLLRKYLQSKDNTLRGYSMVALVEIEDKESYQEIESIFRETEIPILILKGAIAMSMFNIDDYIDIALKKLETVECPCFIKCEMLYYVAKATGIGNEFNFFLRHYNDNPRDGVYWIIDKLKENSKLDDGYRKVEDFYNNNKCKAETIKYLSENLKHHKSEAGKLIEVIENTKEANIVNEIIYFMFILLNKINNGIFFPSKNLSVLSLLNRNRKYESVNRELISVDKLIYRRTRLSERAIIFYLKSPNSLIRLKALKALTNKKVLKKFQPALLKELKNGEHSTGLFAASLVGINKMYEAVPLLRKYLHSEDCLLKGYSMVALAELEDKPSYREIENILSEAEIPILILKGSIAMSMFNSKDYIDIALKKLLTIECPCVIQCEMLYYVAKAIGIGDEFYIFLRHYIDKKRDGVYWLVDKLKKNSKLGDAYKEAEDYYENSKSKIVTIDYLYKNLNRNKLEAKELIKVIENTNNKDIGDEIIYLMFMLLNKMNR
ncbi:MAG: hypothetical protein GY756_22175 [bacterium]|nr:hypothetical protein [bacterium]